jgi:mRNA interferase RelE/StbE
MYEVSFTSKALRQFAKLPVEVQQRLQDAIDALELEPRPDGVKKLRGRTNEYRIRIGPYRVIYTVEDRKLVVTVIKVGLRADIYDG